MSERRPSAAPLEALTLLTLLPATRTMRSHSPSATAAWFPVVGLLFSALGVSVALLATALMAKGVPALGAGTDSGGMVTSTLVVVSWALLSRLMHWDGLADVADAYWGGDTTERRLQIMTDSAVGAFGVTGIVFVCLLQISSLAVVGSEHLGVFLAVVVAMPVMGRLSATFAAWFGAPARSEGLGSRYHFGPTALGVLVTLLAVAIAIAPSAMMLEPAVAAMVAVVGLLGASAIPHVLARRFGGTTGDVMGASILLTETVVAVSAALVMGGL